MTLFKTFDIKTNAILSFLCIFLTLPTLAMAHCDTLNGPVVEEARKALDSNDVTPVLKWVSGDDEQVIRDAFINTVEVRKLGEKAKQLVDMYFYETLVRIHRASEGAPYTGLKPGSEIDPAVVMADKALENGSADKLIAVLTKAIADGIRERFLHAFETKKQANESIAAGREFVKAYVSLTHYVEGLHSFVKKGAEHSNHQ